MNEFDLIYFSDHVEVYKNGVFQFSADNQNEVMHELSEITSAWLQI